MIFGVLKDIKEGENRVICTPVEVASIKAAGHTVLVQSGAGVGSGFSDEKYAAAGGEIVSAAEEMWKRCDFLAKVKEIQPDEFGLPREGQMIYCCIHPAGHPEEVDALLQSKCIAITAEDSHRYGSPNCEAAGKQGALFGLESMLTINGGKGKFVGGFAGAPGMNVLILGGGTVGQGALSVLHAPGAIESSHETHHDNPRYVVNGVVHYCVSNIPGAVAHSTSVSLAAETLPMLLSIMNDGLAEACVKDGFIRRSLTCYKGYLTHEETSGIQGKPWVRPEDILGIAARQLDPAPPAPTPRSTNFIKL